MGGSSKQVTGHKYFATFVGMIGNCIEGIWGWNFDNKGWIGDEDGKLITDGKFKIDKENFYGETEGGISGFVDVKTGSPTQTKNDIYAAYLAQNHLPPVAYRYLSYLVYEDFYWGNNPFMKEILVWPKRIHKKFDGSVQWYDEKSEINYASNNHISGAELNKNRDLVLREASTRLQNIWYGTKKINGGAFEQIQDNNEPSKGLKGTNGVWHFDSGTQGAIGDVGKIRTSFKTGVLVAIELTILCDDGLQSFSWTGLKSVVVNEWSEQGWVTCKKIILITNLDGTGDLLANVINGFPAGTDTQHRVAASCRLLEAGSDSLLFPSIDINPIHKIREILTDYVALNKSEIDIDEDNFKSAADRIYDEGLGISYAIQEAKCIEVLNDICSHIEGAVRINRQTGKYQVVLFRDDWFDLEQAQRFDEKSIKTFEAEITNADGPVNVLNINYYDRANIKNSSFNLADVGSIHTIGGEISQTVDFPYFMNRRNAEMVGNWKLKQLSTGAWKGTFTTGKYEARKINRYDVIKISFVKRGIVQLPVRVMNIKLGNGRDNTVSIDFVEVIPYSGQSFTAITVDPPFENALSPQPTQPTVFEMPYFEAVQQFGQSQVDLELSNNPELSYLAAAAPKPQNNSLNALLYTDGATGIYTNFERVSSLSYCQALFLDQSIDYLDTSFAVKDIDFVEQRNTPKFVNTEADTVIQLHDELMAFVSYDTETNIITVKRGVLDTLPQKHSNGSLVFWGESIAYDSTQYVQSEAVQAQVLTTTPSAVQQLNIANVEAIEMNARAIRPYPPANVKINGEYYPPEIETDLTLTWADRNRVQQTGGSLLSWVDGSVALEAGANYQLTLIERDEADITLRSQIINLGTLNTYTFATSAMNANTRAIEIILKSVRDGFESYQSFNHTVELSQFFSAPYDLTVEFKND